MRDYTGSPNRVREMAAAVEHRDGEIEQLIDWSAVEIVLAAIYGSDEGRPPSGRQGTAAAFGEARHGTVSQRDPAAGWTTKNGKSTFG